MSYMTRDTTCVHYRKCTHPNYFEDKCNKKCIKYVGKVVKKCECGCDADKEVPICFRCLQFMKSTTWR
jgi:hypothetical protein